MNPKVLLDAFAEERVDFVLIGGLAATLHGTTRVTRDIDIAYATDAANLARICKVVNRFEPRQIFLGQAHGRVITLTPKFLKREPMLRLATSIGEIDLLSKVDGFDSYGFIKRSAELQNLGVPTLVLSIGGLLRAKRAMKRPKDLQDIVELEALDEVRRDA